MNAPSAGYADIKAHRINRRRDHSAIFVARVREELARRIYDRRDFGRVERIAKIAKRAVGLFPGGLVANQPRRISRDVFPTEISDRSAGFLPRSLFPVPAAVHGSRALIASNERVSSAATTAL